MNCACVHASPHLLCRCSLSPAVWEGGQAFRFYTLQSDAKSPSSWFKSWPQQFPEHSPDDALRVHVLPYELFLSQARIVSLLLCFLFLSQSPLGSSCPNWLLDSSVSVCPYSCQRLPHGLEHWTVYSYTLPKITFPKLHFPTLRHCFRSICLPFWSWHLFGDWHI